MIDFSNIKLPIYSNKYGQGDYLELIDYLSQKISEFRLEPRRKERNAIMGSMALPLIVFYSEWYRRDYVGGKGSQQWEDPLINKGICTKEAFSEIRTLLVKKVGEQYDILANRHDLVDNNGQLLRSILCQGGLPIEYIIHGRENNSFFTLLHWIVSESLNNEAPSIGEIKARTEQLCMSPTLTGIDTCKATLTLAESITAEAVVPFNVSENTLRELESKLKEDRERVKKLGLNKPIFFKEFFIEPNPEGGFDFKYTIRLEESFSVERAYRFGLSPDVQRFTVSHKGDSLGRYIRMSDGLFHCREFKNKPHVFSETDGGNECSQVDIQTDLSSNDYHCELVSRLSFTGDNILLTELKDGVWIVKNRFNDEGTFYVWVPRTYTVNAEDGFVSECSLSGCNYYRVLINQLHPATLFSPDGKQLDPHHLFLTDYTVSFHGLTSSWLLASNVHIISDLPDDYNIQVYDNINQRRELKYSVKYRVKNEKEYHDISSSLPEGIVFIRVDVGYQQVEGRFFYAKGLDCEIDTHKQAICWSKSGNCEVISDSADIVENEPGVFSLRNQATVRTIGFQLKANKDIAIIEAPAPTNNIRVLDVDGNLLHSGQRICIQNLQYYNVYSPGKGETRVSITSCTGAQSGTPTVFTRRLPFKSSLSDFKREIESVYYAETMSPLNNTHEYVELSFPDSGLSFKCVYYNRLAEPDDANKKINVIDTGYRKDESITGLYYVTLDCDPDDIAIGELNQSEDKEFHYPEVNSSIMVLPRLDGNINLVRPTLLPFSLKETNWREEIMSSCSPHDVVWKKLYRYYDVCRQYAIPFDVFNCFQAICGKYVKNFDGKKADICPPEEYQTYVSRFALSMLCEYNTPVDDLLLKFARCFNFMWHWISMDKWGEALTWGGFDYLDAFKKLSQLISEELCLPSTNQPIICTHYLDFGYEEFPIDQMSFGEIVNGSYKHITTSFNDFISRIRPLVENTIAIQGPRIDLYGDTDIIKSINGIKNKGERQLFKSAYVAAALFTGKYSGRFRNPKAILYAQMNTSVYSLVFTNILRYI